MNTATKVLVAVIVIALIAGAAYYLLAGSAPMMPGDTTATNNVPAATGSVDDFAAAMEAEVNASAAAIKALDADVDASVSNVQVTSQTVTSYDPNTI